MVYKTGLIGSMGSMWLEVVIGVAIVAAVVEASPLEVSV